MEAAVTEPTADREDLAKKASEFLLGVLERMGISADIDIKDDTAGLIPWDKAKHFIVFYGLTFLATVALPRSRFWKIGLVLR